MATLLASPAIVHRQRAYTGKDLPVEVAALLASVSRSAACAALAEVDLQLMGGEIHALCGENGAGKSTLIKILAGFYAPDDGEVAVAGRPLPRSVKAAAEQGVSVIHQESIACPHLDAVDNIFVGRELRQLGGLLLALRAMGGRPRICSLIWEKSSTRRGPVGDLPMAQRQMISMARALSQRCRLLIMDEPTASLSARETKTLFAIIRRLRDEGVSILYVTHRMEEIFELADRVTILRDGRRVDTRPIDGLTPATLVEMMVGRDIEPLPHESPHQAHHSSPPALAVRAFTRHGEFEEISFDVRPGEVVGLAGLVGAGRSEVAAAIFGVTSYDHGDVSLAGKPLQRGQVGCEHSRGAGVCSGRPAAPRIGAAHVGVAKPDVNGAAVAYSIWHYPRHGGARRFRAACSGP